MKRNGNIVESSVMVIVSASILMWFFEIDVQDIKDKVNEHNQTQQVEECACPEPIVCPQQQIVSPIESVVEVDIYEPVEAPVINVDNTGTGY